MQRVFANPTEIEKIAKKTYGIPDFLMMENAATSMSDFILSSWNKQTTSQPKVLIVCGKGNNGGDGYALARKLQGKANVSVCCFEEPAQSVSEAYIQFEMCRKLGICFLQKEQLFAEIGAFDFIVDCLYGTGFHGELKPEAAELIKHLNQNASSHCFKIACDIPSAFFFKADYTISMGTQKLCFYSDEAKQACGKIIVANLGLERNKFEQATEVPSSIYLIEKDDIKLPLRKNPAAHKGTYGHTAVFAGEKSGAAIIAATAAMNFGSGLTTLVKTNNSNLEQFKISPELMISNSIPAKTSCLVMGPGMNGLTELTQKERAGFLEWFDKNEKAAVVFDAGIVSSEDFIPLLNELSRKIKNNKDDSSENKLPRIVLTPHLSEFSRFCRNIKAASTSGYFDNKAFNFVDEDFSIDTLTKSPETKIKLGKMITALFPNTTLVVKSANTFIFTALATSENTTTNANTTHETSTCETYIIADGAPSLAKGGSGDVLAGMIGALLAQGYNAKEAAVTACEVHALAAASYGKESFDLTPEKLIAKIISL